MSEHALIQLEPRLSEVWISRGRSVWVMRSDGACSGGAGAGFFFNQTRLVSRHAYTIDGASAHPAGTSAVSSSSWMGYYAAYPHSLGRPAEDKGSGQVSAASVQTLEMRLIRQVGTGFHEDVLLTNHTQAPVTFTLELQMDGDFADAEEVKGRRRQKGRLTWRWKRSSPREWTLKADYRCFRRFSVQGNRGTASLWRGFEFRLRPDSGQCRRFLNRIRVPVTLAPHHTWRLCTELTPHDQGKPLPFSYVCSTPGGVPKSGKRSNEDPTASFHTAESGGLSPVVIRALDRAREDLEGLRLNDMDGPGAAWTVSAGLPVYNAFFGRDALTAGWQAAMLTPHLMSGALARVAERQGRVHNPWLDESPGRMLHEAHTGPLAVLRITPRLRYYGAVTTSAMHAFVLSEFWHWTADKKTTAKLIDPALRALAWLDRDAARDGFYEYKTRSVDGVKNQAWKDSQDAIVYPDGKDAEPPLATCEEQAFAYVAKLHLSEVLWWLGRKNEARNLHRDARELKRRFNEAFWMPEEGFFALALDKSRKPIRSITSNPGHCLAAGIIDKSLIRSTVNRLFQSDLFSGWGIRTLSDAHPAYNPFSYHRGSVWPVEQGTFALGLMRFGFFPEVQRLARSLFELSGLFEHGRLPELVSGHRRSHACPFPALYQNENSPQAWSSSAVVCAVQSLLGLYPYAPLNLLMVDPHLPAWLPELTVENLRVGRATLSIRFFRRSNGSSDYRVLQKRGTLHVVHQPSPWSMAAPLGERFRDLIHGLRPGR